MIDERFGKWIVLSKGNFKHNQQHWWCRCDCGIEKEISVQHLRNRKSTQCLKCRGKQRSEEARQENSGMYSTVGFRTKWMINEAKTSYSEQSGICPICNKNLPDLLKCVWDHDHKTGMRRALVHRGCNVFLGFIERDSTLLTRVIKYCKQYGIEHGTE